MGKEYAFLLKLGFLGRFEHSLDEKGRVSIPAKYKKYIEQTTEDPEYRNTVILVKSKDKCIEVLPSEAWDKMMKDFSDNMKMDDESDDRSYVNRKFMNAVDVKIDKSGRILIPPHLSEYAGIDKKAVFVGGGDRFYIWEEKALKELEK